MAVGSSSSNSGLLEAPPSGGGADAAAAVASWIWTSTTAAATATAGRGRNTAVGFRGGGPRQEQRRHPFPSVSTILFRRTVWGSGEIFYVCGSNAVYDQPESPPPPNAPMGFVYHAARTGTRTSTAVLRRDDLTAMVPHTANMATSLVAVPSRASPREFALTSAVCRRVSGREMMKKSRCDLFWRGNRLVWGVAAANDDGGDDDEQTSSGLGWQQQLGSERHGGELQHNGVVMEGVDSSGSVPSRK